MMTVIDTPYGSFPSNYQLKKLKELCVKKIGIQTGPFGSQLHNSDYVIVGTPILTVEHLGENRILHDDLPCVSEKDRERLARYTLKKGDIAFSRVGSVDRRALVRDEEDGWLFSGRCLRIRPDPEKIDSMFLSYLLGLPTFKEYIRKIAVGATMPSINTEILSNIPICYPPLPIQHRIAHILGSLDDKIELNRQMNETLEAMARAIFKSWFVDFDPVRAKTEGRQPAGMDAETAALFPDGFEEVEGREVPRGWKFSSLDGIFPHSNDCVVTGPFGSNLHASDYRDDGVPIILVKHVMDGHILDNDLPKVGHHKLPDLKRYTLKKGDIVFTRVGAVGRSAYVQDHQEGWLISGQTLRVRIPDWNILHPRYLAQVFLEESFIEMVNNQALGTTRPSINTQLLLNFKFIAPPGELVKKFVEKISKIDELLHNNMEQSHTLAQIRDALLPKLMSGEIQVGDIK